MKQLVYSALLAFIISAPSAKATDEDAGATLPSNISQEAVREPGVEQELRNKEAFAFSKLQEAQEAVLRGEITTEDLEPLRDQYEKAQEALEAAGCSAAGFKN